MTHIGGWGWFWPGHHFVWLGVVCLCRTWSIPFVYCRFLFISCYFGCFVFVELGRDAFLCSLLLSNLTWRGRFVAVVAAARASATRHKSGCFAAKKTPVRKIDVVQVSTTCITYNSCNTLTLYDNIFRRLDCRAPRGQSWRIRARSFAKPGVDLA